MIECETCGGSGWEKTFPPGRSIPIHAECPDCKDENDPEGETDRAEVRE